MGHLFISQKAQDTAAQRVVLQRESIMRACFYVGWAVRADDAPAGNHLDDRFIKRKSDIALRELTAGSAK
jgi:hypothetical protein